MKYIRTKDGNIELNREEIEREIIKQSNNLEELIDGLIVEDKNYKDTWFIMETSEFMKMPIKERKYMWKDWKYNAYIKTKKGLIYKAKMNEEGELELL